MTTVASARLLVNDHIAEPLYPTGQERLVLLVVLVVVAVVLFRAVGVLVALALELLRPAVRLGGLLLAVLALIGLLLVSLAADAPQDGESVRKPPASTSVRARPTPTVSPARSVAPIPSMGPLRPVRP